MTDGSLLSTERVRFHKRCTERLLVFASSTPDKGKYKGTEVLSASNADSSNEASKAIADHIARELGAENGKKLPGQTAGGLFEQLVADYLASTFPKLEQFRPGDWLINVVTDRSQSSVSKHEQYTHVSTLSSLADADKVLKASLGNDYTIAPDILISRKKYGDPELNSKSHIVGDDAGLLGAIRQKSGPANILHASISCKWTMRSDRAQNSRAEALNLIRNRKGRVPHIIAVVGEPTPSRLASLALGTGDLDCVYHFALYELQRAVAALGQSEAIDLLEIMIEGRRLKDISDLPLDLAV